MGMTFIHMYEGRLILVSEQTGGFGKENVPYALVKRVGQEPFFVGTRYYRRDTLLGVCLVGATRVQENDVIQIRGHDRMTRIFVVKNGGLTPLERAFDIEASIGSSLK